MKKNGGMRGIAGVKGAKYIHLKGKIAGNIDKSRGKTKGHEGKRNNPRLEGVLPWTTGLALDHPYWVILGRFLLSSLIHMASKHLIIL